MALQIAYKFLKYSPDVTANLIGVKQAQLIASAYEDAALYIDMIVKIFFILGALALGPQFLTLQSASMPSLPVANLHSGCGACCLGEYPNAHTPDGIPDGLPESRSLLTLRQFFLQVNNGSSLR